MRLPGFIIGGAPRSATTWLYRLAERHPTIAMAKPAQPEPKFFLIDELYAKGLGHYAATWFEGLPPDKLLGEKSTNYLEGPPVAERMWRTLPTVRLIFLLRNPVDRAYSNYLWSQRNGFETESFGRALELEPCREHGLPAELRYARPYAYFSRGLYASLLTRFFYFFPHRQILVLRTEDIVARPDWVAVRLQEFLEVEVQPDLAADLNRVNAAYPDGGPAMPLEVRDALEKRYAEPNRELSKLLGTDSSLWP